MKKHKLRNSFYMRILIISIILFLLTSSILIILTKSLSEDYERTNLLKDNNLSLSNIYGVFYDKHRNFSTLMSYFYKSNTSYSNLCSLLSVSSPAQVDVYTRAQVVETLVDLCAVDKDIVGVLIYSTATQSTFYFNQSSRIIAPFKMNSPFPEHTPYQRYVLTNSQLQESSSYFGENTPHVYGLVGYISALSNDRFTLLGEIVVLYSTNGLAEAINVPNYNANAAFRITDLSGNMIFNSLGDYESVSLSQSDQSSNLNLININNTSYYMSSLLNTQRDFLVSYQIPKSMVDQGSRYFQGLMTVVAVSICTVSLFSCLYAYQQSMKKIGMVEKGMENIGSHNLSYRISNIKGSDEFSNIIIYFNQMCDDLQRNIEKMYMYEIQQKNAELYALQTSINPHFLFNTLESIRVRVSSNDNQDAAQMLVLLSKLYRNQIKGKMFVTLFEELVQCKMLIELNYCRFQNFECILRIPSEFNQFGIPKNTLQPLIENYFEHGIDLDREDNLLEIDAAWANTDNDRCIRIIVSDNGKTMPDQKLESLSSMLSEPILQHTLSGGFGLVNVNSRLRIVFGHQYGLKLHFNKEGKGFQIEILIKPISPEELSDTHTTLSKLSAQEDRNV